MPAIRSMNLSNRPLVRVEIVCFCNLQILLGAGACGSMAKGYLLDFRRFRRGIFLDSIDSAADTLRSTCASIRGSPECNMHGFPDETRHVGQGTIKNAFLGRSLSRIGIGSFRNIEDLPKLECLA